MKNFHIVVLCALITGLAACNGAANLSKDDTPSYQDLKITLEREACFGSCPAYVVEISQDGLVNFCGINFVEFPGQRSRKVDPLKVRELYSSISNAGFFDLNDSYRGLVTDMPTFTVSVSVDGRQKTVEDYAGSMVGMPETVKVIQAAIDTTAGVEEWIGEGSVTSKTKQFDCEVAHLKKKYAAPSL